MPSYFERDAPKGYTDGLLAYVGLTPSSESYRPFDGLTPANLERILERAPHLADQTQNDSPTMAAFSDLGAKYPHIRFHGYVIGPERNDERISIEGWECFDILRKPNALDICANENLSPDELNESRAWWD
jgi:hypothetical protein